MWETPEALFDKLHAIHDFTFDVCATPENAKCPRFYTPEMDGLKQTWTGVCWMNPPYGKVIKHWVKKAYESATTGDAKVVCLLPARTDTGWWHDYVIPYGKIEFLRGRLRFVNRALPSYRDDGKFKISSAPFPSAIVIFE